MAECKIDTSGQYFVIHKKTETEKRNVCQNNEFLCSRQWKREITSLCSYFKCKTLEVSVSRVCRFWIFVLACVFYCFFSFIWWLSFISLVLGSSKDGTEKVLVMKSVFWFLFCHWPFTWSEANNSKSAVFCTQIAGCQSISQILTNFREFSKGLKMFLCNAVKTSIMKSHLAFYEVAVSVDEGHQYILFTVDFSNTFDAVSYNYWSWSQINGLWEGLNCLA